MNRRIRALALVVLLALAGSCAPSPGAPTVLLVTVDTWRADRSSLYGSPRPTSRNLEAIAAEGVVFERALAPAPWTWPTMATLASGIGPDSHGATEPMLPLCGEVDTVAEVFAAAGWDTHFAGVNPYFLAELNGYRQGFKTFWARGLADDQAALDALLGALDASKGRPAYLHLHLFGPHSPFTPGGAAMDEVAAAPPPARRRSRYPGDVAPFGIDTRCMEAGLDPRARTERELEAYDAELLELDLVLGRLRDAMRRRGRWRGAWVVITGDHGEEFCEHGAVGHGDQVYAETAWVPLVVRLPEGVTPARRRVGGATSLLHVPPTLVAAASLPAPAPWQGEDLAPRFLADREAVPGGALSATAALSGALRFEDEEGTLAFDCCEAGGGKGALRVYGPEDRLDDVSVLGRPLEPGRLLSAAGLARRAGATLRGQLEARPCVPEPLPPDQDHEEALRAAGYLSD